MSADYDNGAFKFAREIWEQAERSVGDENFNRLLVRGLHELTARLEDQLEDIRALLERAYDRESPK